MKKDSLTMLFEHLELMLNGSKIAVYITGITILRHQFDVEPAGKTG